MHRLAPQPVLLISWYPIITVMSTVVRVITVTRSKAGGLQYIFSHPPIIFNKSRRPPYFTKTRRILNKNSGFIILTTYIIK